MPMQKRKQMRKFHRKLNKSLEWREKVKTRETHWQLKAKSTNIECPHSERVRVASGIRHSHSQVMYIQHTVILNVKNKFVVQLHCHLTIDNHRMMNVGTEGVRKINDQHQAIISCKMRNTKPKQPTTNIGLRMIELYGAHTVQMKCSKWTERKNNTKSITGECNNNNTNHNSQRTELIDAKKKWEIEKKK